jgi:hypothetical protein
MALPRLVLPALDCLPGCSRGRQALGSTGNTRRRYLRRGGRLRRARRRARLNEAGAKVVLLEAKDRPGARSWMPALLMADGSIWWPMGRSMRSSPEWAARPRPRQSSTSPSCSQSERKSWCRSAATMPSAFPAHKLQAVFERIEEMSRSIDPEAPRTYPDAERLDATTYQGLAA